MSDTEAKLWRDMTPEEKGALLLAHHEGHTIQCRSPAHSQWFDSSEPSWANAIAYRVRPEPNRETVTRWYQASGHSNTHRIAFDLIDGEPDCASIRMESLMEPG